MKKGWVILKANGERVEVESNTKPTLQQMQDAVGGYIAYIPCQYANEKRTMVVNEEGLAKGLKPNISATLIIGGKITGDVMILIGFRG